MSYHGEDAVEVGKEALYIMCIYECNGFNAVTERVQQNGVFMSNFISDQNPETEQLC